MSLLVTLGTRNEFERCRAVLEELGLVYHVLDSEPGFSLVAAPAIVVDEAVRATLARQPDHAFVCAGWVYHRPSDVQMTNVCLPPSDEALFGQAGIVVLAPCVADPSRIRIIAHVTGDLLPVLPYLNAGMERASYNPRSSVLTFMDEYRLVSMQAHRITVAKADEIVDAWRTLDDLRKRVDEVWAARDGIVPSYETRERPPRPRDLQEAPQDQLQGVRTAQLSRVCRLSLARRRIGERVYARLRGGWRASRVASGFGGRLCSARRVSSSKREARWCGRAEIAWRGWGRHMRAERIAFFSDVHGNAGALRAVLADIQASGIDCMYCLGDLVGHGPHPNEVIDLIRAAGIPTIAGNYDDGVAFERGECGCFYADEEARRIGDASYAFTVAAVTEENKAWLRGLPRELRFEVAGVRFHLVHGSPRRINEYLLKDRDPRTYERLARTEEADVLVFGHTHVPWHHRHGGTLFINVGSAGRPKDADVRAMYSVMEVSQGVEPEVQTARV